MYLFQLKKYICEGQNKALKSKTIVPPVKHSGGNISLQGGGTVYPVKLMEYYNYLTTCK